LWIKLGLCVVGTSVQSTGLDLDTQAVGQQHASPLCALCEARRREVSVFLAVCGCGCCSCIARGTSVLSSQLPNTELLFWGGVTGKLDVRLRPRSGVELTTKADAKICSSPQQRTGVFPSGYLFRIAGATTSSARSKLSTRKGSLRKSFDWQVIGRASEHTAFLPPPALQLNPSNKHPAS